MNRPNRLFATRPVVRLCASALLTTVGLGLSQPGWATEGGIGRPITGMQVMPYAGVVPPTDDWIVSATTIYYEGSLSRNTVLPVAGTITQGLNMSVSTPSPMR